VRAGMLTKLFSTPKVPRKRRARGEERKKDAKNPKGNATTNGNVDKGKGKGKFHPDHPLKEKRECHGPISFSPQYNR